MSFARTKIQPPRSRAGSLIDRPGLEQRLNQALRSRRLVLLCAAAGFGKTTALVRQIERLPPDTALAWVACDRSDTPAQLFECLIAALEPLDPPWRMAPEALVRIAAESGTPAQRWRVATEVINALDACEVAHGVIVIDDLHRVEHNEVIEFLDLLLERLPPRWTLVISTRVEPGLALARLRAADELAEFRNEALRFEPAEVQALAAAFGHDASAAERLYQRTQGWPAGLRLALGIRAADGPRHSGAIDRAVFDFLASEVIDRLDPALHDFLVLTSVLPELTATRCAALTGRADAARWLDQIERAGLFVYSLPGAETTLRLHDLFREALLARLQRERPEQLQSLLLRAAQSEPEALPRLEGLLRVGAWEEAEALMAEVAEGQIAQGRAQTVAALIEQFPPQRRDASPRLQLVRAMLSWSRWDWSGAIEATARAARGWSDAGDAAAGRVARSYHAVALAGANHLGAAAAVDALLADPALDGDALVRGLIAGCWVALRTDQSQVAPRFSRLLDTLETIPNLTRWYEGSPLPPFVGLPGTRAPLERYLSGAFALLPDQPTPLRGVCLVLRGWLQLWRGDVDGAERNAEAALGDARWLGQPINVDSYARSLQAVLLALRGRADPALQMVQSLLADVEAATDPMRVRVYLSLYLFLAWRIAALLDRRDAAAGYARRLAALDGEAQSWLSLPQRAGAAAYAAFVRGELDQACGAWRELLDREGCSDLYGQVAETRLRLADALWQRGRPPAEAAAVLLPLLERAAAEGECGPALMAGPALLQRLASRDWASTLDAEHSRLLERWAALARELAAGAAAADAGAGGAHPGAATPLTQREWEVLQLIAAGDSNKLIARALDLSPHTVKRHVANILDKLALASRAQAAAWHRAQAQ